MYLQDCSKIFALALGKHLGKFPGLAGMRDFLTLHYSAGFDSLSVGEYHGQVISNKSPTRFQ